MGRAGLSPHALAGEAEVGADQARTLGSLPQAHCMWDSALRGLGSGLRSSSSESLFGDVRSLDERLREAGSQRCPSLPAHLGTNECSQDAGRPVLSC